MHLGVWKDEGLRVEVTTATTGDELTHKVLDGTADLGLAGPIRTLELAEHEMGGSLMSFIEVCSRNGFFLLAHEPKPSFQWADLVGQRLILFAEAPTPWLCLQDILRRHGIDPSAVHVRSGLATADAVASFLRGEAEYLEQSQPATEALVSSGQAAIVAAEGEATGALPFSAYLTHRRYAKERSELLHRFTRAFYRAQQWIAAHSAQELSELIEPSFAEIPSPLRTRILDRYLRQQTWARDPLVRQGGFDNLQDILRGARVISRRYPYTDHVDVTFAQSAMA